MPASRFVRPTVKIVIVLLGCYSAYLIYQYRSGLAPTQAKTSFNELTVYVSVLESESRKEQKPLACSPTVAETFHFKDEWGGLLECSTDKDHLFIKSAGRDGIMGNADDLVVRRRLAF